jgi:hypothetical protein
MTKSHGKLRGKNVSSVGLVVALALVTVVGASAARARIVDRSPPAAPAARPGSTLSLPALDRAVARLAAEARTGD